MATNQELDTNLVENEQPTVPTVNIEMNVIHLIKINLLPK